MSEEIEEAEGDENSPAKAAVVGERLPEFIDLALGKDLDEAGAREITCNRPARLIVVAGPVKCGKTTILLSIYELFLVGEMPGWLFAGTATFHGYEQRCHPSRIASGKETAHTERTLTNREDGVHYLHLQLAREEMPEQHVDFLFTDLTGEIYEDARDSTDECKELTFAARADHFILVLDGKKVASELARRAVVEEGQSILRSMADSGVLTTDSFVCVLFTKYDHFNTPKAAADCAAFHADVIREMTAEFGPRFGRLTFADAAARPQVNRQLPFGYGLVDLLNDWATSSSRFRKMNLSRAPAAARRESDLFYQRHFYAR